MAKSIVGLEITSRRLLAAEVDGAQSAKATLMRAQQLDLEPGVARDSEVSDLTAASDALRRFWREAGFRSKRVVLGMGNQRVLVRNHAVPVMPLTQLQQALPFQVADLLPVPVDETILDFYPIEAVADSNPAQMRGLLVAALKEAIEVNVAAIENAGLKVVGVDLSAFALVRTLAQSGVLQGTHTIVLIGSRTTHIVVVRDAVPRFIRILPTGGEMVTDAAEHAITEGRAAAETLKFQLGVEGSDHPRFGAASKAMLEALRGMFSSIGNTNSFYLSNEEETKIDSLILIGSEARMPGLARAIAENVGLPVQIGSSTQGIRVGNQLNAEFLQAMDLDLAVPIGLALRSA